MKIEIAVVIYEGQFWFELDGLKFDTLNAIWELDREVVEVIRAGKMIAKALVSEKRGEPAFSDHYVSEGIRLQGSALRAEDFALNDHVVFNIPDEFNFVNHLKRSCEFLEAVIATMPVGEKMSLDAMWDRIIPELDRTRQTMDATQILRFRRNK